MAYYDKRGSARARIPRKGHPTLSATFGTKAEARRWASQVEGGMSPSRFVDTRKSLTGPSFTASCSQGLGLVCQRY